MKRQQGFTLIELVMVIVILGILSAFALPRFADLGSEARTATLQGAIGAVKSSAAIAHSKWLANSEPETIELEGDSAVAMSTSGYPAASATGIGSAAQIEADFDIGEATSGVTIISLKDGESPRTNCSFEYNDSTGEVDPDEITTSGC